MGALVVLPGVTDCQVRAGSEVRATPTGGNTYAEFLALVAQRPGANFSCLGAATALANIGLTGLKIAAATNPGVDLVGYASAEGSTRAGASSHKKYNVQEGIIVPRSLRCDHQGDAVAAFDLIATYDGTNDPVAETDSQSVDTAATDDERYTIGGITLGNIALTGFRSVEINFGVVARSVGADSDIWDTFCYIPTISPTIVFRGIDPLWFDAAAVPLIGLVGTQANTTIYLRKRAATGYVANGTAEHIKINAAGLVTLDNIFSASGDAEGETSIMMTTQYDGTNAPLVINTASAIT